MSANSFVLALLTWYPILPGAVMCFAPMGSQLKAGKRNTMFRVLAFAVILIPALAFLETAFPLRHITLIPLAFVLTFGFYHLNLRTPLCKTLAMYLLVVDFLAFLINFANGFDAAIHPDSTLDNFSLEASMFQIAITTVFAALVYRPLTRFGTLLIDQFDLQKVWYSTLPISGILLIYNLMIAPRRYETVHINLAFLFYWVSLSLLTVLLMLLCVIFYFIVSGMMEAAEERERNRILEMQESAYLTQQRYLEETAKTRHDFKHTIGTLDVLISQGDLAAIRAFMDEYLASQPQKENEVFCHNTAVNALLNYYVQMAKADGTPLELEIIMGDELPVSDIDLCSILGNILENAILACRNLPAEHRFIDLVVDAEPGAPVYIVATNSFDGKIFRDNNGDYQSIRGRGLGLRSIRQAARKYDGTARFSDNTGSGGVAEFCTDVVLQGAEPPEA